MTREDLKAIEGLTPDQVDAVMGIHGRDAAAWHDKEAELQQQVATARKGLEAFGSATPESVEAMQRQIAQLQADMTAQAERYRFEALLHAAARKAGALNEDDAVTLLPGKDKLAQSQNIEADIAAAMQQLKADKPYLFPTPPAVQPEPETTPNGGRPIVVPKPRAAGGSDPTLDDFRNMTGRERMELKAKNPALFQQFLRELSAARR